MSGRVPFFPSAIDKSVALIAVDVTNSLQLPGVSGEVLCAALVELGVTALDDLAAIGEGDIAAPLGLRKISVRRLSNALLAEIVARKDSVPYEKEFELRPAEAIEFSPRTCAESAAGSRVLQSTENSVGVYSTERQLNQEITGAAPPLVPVPASQAGFLFANSEAAGDESSSDKSDDDDFNPIAIEELDARFEEENNGRRGKARRAQHRRGATWL